MSGRARTRKAGSILQQHGEEGLREFTRETGRMDLWDNHLRRKMATETHGRAGETHQRAGQTHGLQMASGREALSQSQEKMGWIRDDRLDAKGKQQLKESAQHVLSTWVGGPENFKGNLPAINRIVKQNPALFQKVLALGNDRVPMGFEFVEGGPIGQPEMTMMIYNKKTNSVGPATANASADKADSVISVDPAAKSIPSCPVSPAAARRRPPRRRAGSRRPPSATRRPRSIPGPELTERPNTTLRRNRASSKTTTTRKTGRSWQPRPDRRKNRRFWERDLSSVARRRAGTVVNIGGIGKPPKGLARSSGRRGELETGAGSRRTCRSEESKRRKRKEGDRAGVKERQASLVTNHADAIRKTMKKSRLPTTGLGGSLLADLPGTSAHDMQNRLSTIKALVGFNQLNEMRANSPTGGALGNVTEKELKFLQSVIGSLEQSQTKDQFLENLKTVEDSFNKIVHGAQPTAGATPQNAPGLVAPESAPPLNLPPGTQGTVPGAGGVPAGAAPLSAGQPLPGAVDEAAWAWRNWGGRSIFAGGRRERRNGGRGRNGTKRWRTCGCAGRGCSGLLQVEHVRAVFPQYRQTCRRRRRGLSPQRWSAGRRRPAGRHRRCRGNRRSHQKRQRRRQTDATATAATPNFQAMDDNALYTGSIRRRSLRRKRSRRFLAELQAEDGSGEGSARRKRSGQAGEAAAQAVTASGRCRRGGIECAGGHALMSDLDAQISAAQAGESSQNHQAGTRARRQRARPT